MTTEIRAMLERICNVCGMEVYTIRHESRKLYRLYTRLDYARDGVSGDKMLCDWVSARSAYHFLRGLAAGLECE